MITLRVCVNLLCLTFLVLVLCSYCSLLVEVGLWKQYIFCGIVVKASSFSVNNLKFSQKY